MIVVVTGGNRGLGLALVGLLRDAGHTVVVGCRAPPPGAAPALDLASPASIARFVAELRGQPIDVLVNNAGAMFATHALTAAGVERTLAVNCVGPLQLTEALAPVRIVNVVTAALGRDALDPGRRFATMSAYLSAKLALMRVARVWATDGKHVQCLHPGMMRTPMLDAPGLGGGAMRYLTPLLRPFAADPIVPARALLRLIVEEHASDTLFHRLRQVSWPAKLRDAALNQRVTAQLRALVPTDHVSPGALQ